MGKVQNSDQ